MLVRSRCRAEVALVIALLSALVAAGCRRDAAPSDAAAPAVSAALSEGATAPTTREVRRVPMSPDSGEAMRSDLQPAESFSDTPEGAARRFMFAWIATNEALMHDAIVPNERWRELLMVQWADSHARISQLEQVMHAPVVEFRPGDDFPVGPPGGPKQLQRVPPDGLDADHRLMMLIERGLMVVRTRDGWRVDAEPIIRSLAQQRAVAETQPARAGATTRSVLVPVPGQRVILEVVPHKQN
ncbi:MAG: hypothetical protein U1A27_07010 [Phycisphaerae bacterium]